MRIVICLKVICHFGYAYNIIIMIFETINRTPGVPMCSVPNENRIGY